MKFVELAMALLVGCTFFSEASPAQNVVVGTQIPQSQQVSIDRISHEPFSQLLQRFVNVKGQVNYGQWKNSSTATKALDSYLATLSSANPQLNSNRANQLAYWINAYNALTIKGILREYPTSSIRNHTSETGGYNIWKTLYLPVGNQHYNLDSIEHKILRKMNEPRIHFAIVCASHSCPRLHMRAYNPQHLEAQLVHNTQNFFANPENFRWDPASQTFHMSSIVQWFGSDFGATQADQLRYLSTYLPVSAQAAATQNAGTIAFLPYSWKLNEIKGPLTQGSSTQQGSLPKQGSSTRQGSAVQQGSSTRQGSTTVQGSNTKPRGRAVRPQGSGTR